MSDAARLPMRQARWPGLVVVALGCAALLGAAAAGSAAATAHGSRGGGPPQARRVVVAISVSSVTANVDTAAASAALARGLQADSLVDLVVRPAPPGRPIRSTRFLVSLMASSVTDPVVRLDVRTFDVATSSVVIRDSVWTFVPAAQDSLMAIGRRLARQLAARAP